MQRTKPTKIVTGKNTTKTKRNDENHVCIERRRGGAYLNVAELVHKKHAQAPLEALHFHEAGEGILKQVSASDDDLAVKKRC